MAIKCTLTVLNRETEMPSKFARLFYQLADGKISAKSFVNAKADLAKVISETRKAGNKIQREQKLEVNPADVATFQFQVTNTDGELTKDMTVNFQVIETLMGLQADVQYRKPRMGKQAQTFNLADFITSAVESESAESAESAES